MTVTQKSIGFSLNIAQLAPEYRPLFTIDPQAVQTWKRFVMVTENEHEHHIAGSIPAEETKSYTAQGFFDQSEDTASAMILSESAMIVSYGRFAGKYDVSTGGLQSIPCVIGLMGVAGRLTFNMSGTLTNGGGAYELLNDKFAGFVALIGLGETGLVDPTDDELTWKRFIVEAVTTPNPSGEPNKRTLSYLNGIQLGPNSAPLIAYRFVILEHVAIYSKLAVWLGGNVAVDITNPSEDTAIFVESIFLQGGEDPYRG